MIKVNVGIALSNGADNWSTGPEIVIDTTAFVDVSVQGEMPHKNKLEYQLNDFADAITSLPVGA